METVIWLVFMIPTSLFFTGLGVFAWKRKQPMWFWAGSTVREKDISDIPAYNKANGVMWIAYSAVFWLSTLIGISHIDAAGAVLAAGCLGGIPCLILSYKRIYGKYGKRNRS